jgi:hypothetical protein
MRLIFIFLGLLLSSVAMAQDLNHADRLFDSYDFQGAAIAYQQAHATKTLNRERSEKLAYCFLRTGANQKGLALIDSLLMLEPTENEFHLWKAEFHRELGDYDQAISSINAYKKFGGSDEIESFITSCNLLKDKTATIDGALLDFHANDSYANHVIVIDQQIVVLMEQGIDSAGNKLGLAGQSTQFSEGLFLKPYALSNGVMNEWKLSTGEEFDLHTIRSLQLNKQLNTVFFIANSPLDLRAASLKPKMYSGQFMGFDQPLRAIEQVSFLPDSLIPLQVAFNSTGDLMVFSAMNGNQSDLFVTYLSQGQWSSPEPLSALNSTSDDLFPVVSGDTLISFSSNRLGGYGGLDLYSAAITSNRPLQIKELNHWKVPMNGTKDDFLLHYLSSDSLIFSSNRFGGKGDDDIWQFVYPAPPVPVEEPKPSINFADLVDKYNLKQVFFDFNSSTTLENVLFDSLFISLFNSLEKTQIVLKGHTDCRGSQRGNYEMGMRRAEWFKQQLVSQGLDASKITTVSLGANEIKNKCVSKSIPCSESEHRENRFVQIHIYH